MWVGVVAFLKSLGIIQIVDWSIIWPVALIILGSSLKHTEKHGMLCMVGGNCGTCGKGSDHKCEGDACGVCK